MRRVATCVVLFSLCSAANLLACGDKYVIFGQGVRFQRAYAATHPASILVYLKSGSRWATPDNRERLLSVLRMVGHRPQAVSTASEVQAAIATGQFDIVLSEADDVAQLTESIVHAAFHPTVVSLLFAPTPDEVAAIERQNSCAVQVSKRNHELLTVVNDVMGQRVKGITAACQRKRA
jgi:hypothetical protein